jgi:hypothetical protein
VKHFLIGLTAFFLTACASLFGGNLSENPDRSSIQNSFEQKSEGTQEPQVILEDYGPAPELTNEVWLNADQPLRLADLRGQVVLLDMWTFG